MVPRSAIYFSRTPEVDEFLKEFIRVRTWLVYQRERSAAAADTNGPHRRVINQDGDFLEAVDKDVDDFLSVAKEMITGTSIHLDAFITLSVSYDDMLQQIDSQSWKKLKPTKFQLDKVMKNAKVEGILFNMFYISLLERKRCSIPPSDDLKSVLREAEERRYQRLVADIREQLNDKPIRLSQAKPPIM